jgi:hypothetical protein
MGILIDRNNDLGSADAVEPVQTLQKESSSTSESEVQAIEETPEPESKLGKQCAP